jgi:hypothetical protein
MFGQQFAGFLHAVGDARGKIAITEITGHGLRQLPPELVAALGMDCCIADDGEFPGARGHQDQNAVSVGGFVQAEAEEFFLGGGHGIFGVFGADQHMDGAGGFAFRFANGRGDILVVQLFGKSSRVHKVLPTAPGSTAAKTTPAARKTASTRKTTATAAATAAPIIT